MLNAALNIDIAEQQLRASKLAFLPSVVFAPNGSISHFGTHTSSTQAYTLPVTASWDVDLFGKLRSQKKVAQMALIQSRDYKVAVQTNLICNVANLYYTLLMLDRQKQIVDEHVWIDEKHLGYDEAADGNSDVLVQQVYRVLRLLIIVYRLKGRILSARS